MAVQETGRVGHEGGCTCGDCPYGAREGHRRAVERFRALRDQFASGGGVPQAVAHSTGASRQWVSDELTQSAEQLTRQSRAESLVWFARARWWTVSALWGVALLVLLLATVTALGSGWTTGRTAGLIALVVIAALVTAGAWMHPATGGALGAVLGEDNRLSVSRAVAALWLLVLLQVLLTQLTVFCLAGDAAAREEALAQLGYRHLLTAALCFAAVNAPAILLPRLTAVRARRGLLQKLPAVRPRLTDLVNDDANRLSYAAVQYLLVNAAVLAFLIGGLVKDTRRLPEVQWGLCLMLVVSAAVFVGARLAEGGRPVILAVTRVREPGDLDGPIRTGDDVQVRGIGFLPRGAEPVDQLARIAVRMGTVHVHVPLVPVPGGFANPTDTVLTVPVPVEVEPGRTNVQVVTAAGAASNVFAIEICE